jgi:hypothetical protein
VHDHPLHPQSHEADIPHRGADFGEYASVKPRIAISQALEQVLMRVRQIASHGPVLRDAQQMNPHKVGEDPAGGRVLHRLALVVGNGGPLVLEGLAKAILQRGLHPHTHGHHHAQRHNPRSLFQSARGGEKARIFAEATTAFRMPLALIAFQAFLGWQGGLVAVVRRQDETALLRNQGLISREPRGESPGTMVAHWGGWHALARSPTLPIVEQGAEGALVHAGALQTVGEGRARLLGIGFTGQGRAASFLHGFDLLGTLLEKLLGDGTSGLQLAGRRGDEALALLDAAIG